MTYSIWETESGNVIGNFVSEASALLAVLDAADLNGPDYVESFALVGNDAGRPKGIASGSGLLKLAHQRCQAMPA
jgi:hypothetical protein